MRITFAPLTVANAAAAHLLLLHCWNTGWDERFASAYLAWRYGARRNGETILALDGDRCVGIIDSFIRPYLIAGRQRLVRETCDWYCLPEYRPLGIGLKLMRRLMARPEPIVSIGGSDMTLALLPRLKWQPLPAVHTYVLPVSARTVLGMASHFVARRFRVRGDWLCRSVPFSLKLRRPRALAAPYREAARPWPTGEDPPLPAADAYAMAALLGQGDAEWLASAPAELGEFLGLGFYADRALVGITLSRLEPGTTGRIAKLLHVQAAGPPATITWIVSETARHLVSRGAGAVIARSSCPTIGEALRRTRFVRCRQAMTFWWPSDAELPPGPVHLTFNRADDALSYDTSPGRSQSVDR